MPVAGGNGDIVFGTDGNIWLGGLTDIIEMTPQAVLLHDYAIPSAGPTSNYHLTLTLGPDGNIWYAEPYKNNAVVGKITLAGQITEYSLPFAEGGPIISGPDGNIWVAGNATMALARVHLDGTIDNYNLPAIPGENGVRGLTSGPDGNLWMATPDPVQPVILRVNTAGQVTGQFNVPTLNSGPYGMTVGSDGALWFAEDRVDQVGRITTDGSITEICIPSGNSTSGAITSGLDGDIWFSEYFGNIIGQLVLRTASNTTVTSSTSPSILGQSVTFTATVSVQVGSGTPTGTVQFGIDGVDFGSPLTLANGSASISTATLTAGPHTIAAVYSGDSSFLPSNGSLTQSVQYNFSGFLPPLSQNMAFALNRTIPIKWQLRDSSGSLITSLSAITSLQVAPVLSGGGLGTPFSPTAAGNTSLRNDGSQYIFNWQTKGLTAGSYEILLTLADGTVMTKVLQLSANGSSAGLVINGATATTAVGGLLGGDITLYVDNTNGDLIADELARIQDAVTAADAVTEPYGVAVTEVTDPTLADVTLNMDTTSAVGGHAAGVLGCTTDVGQITIINGWNFYAGSDATQIASAQYDFETVVTHELGHALGLGHSTDSTSVMYATLNTGAVNRTLTTADLNVADSDTTGACGLHAEVIPIPAASNVPLLDAPCREAFFAMFAIPAHAPALATNALALSAYDAVFAIPAGDIGTANSAALSATPIFGAVASLETAADPFSLSPEDGAGTLLTPSAPPTDRPDLQLDFIPADEAFVVEC
jgi:virginiamycin B lyase